MSEKNSTVIYDASRDRELIVSLRENRNNCYGALYVRGDATIEKTNDPRVRPSAGRKRIDTSTNYKAEPSKVIKLVKIPTVSYIMILSTIGDHEETDCQQIKG
jgi:hypothetical protein